MSKPCTAMGEHGYVSKLYTAMRKHRFTLKACTAMTEHSCTARSCIEVARRQFAGSRGITGTLTIAIRRYKSMNARLMSAERGFKGRGT